MKYFVCKQAERKLNISLLYQRLTQALYFFFFLVFQVQHMPRFQLYSSTHICTGEYVRGHFIFLDKLFNYYNQKKTFSCQLVNILYIIYLYFYVSNKKNTDCWKCKRIAFYTFIL